MTRDQMHNTLRYVREQLAEERGSDFSGVKALDLVLEELEQESSGDLISRQAVLEQINCWIGGGEYGYTNATHYLTERVKHIPSVNPQEPKTGHWVDGLIAKVLEEVDGGTDDMYIRYADICNRVEKSIREYCGAKMVEPQESEDKE